MPLATVACEEPFHPPPSVAVISITPDSAVVRWGASLKLKATLRDAAGVEQRSIPVNWTSSRPSVVPVSHDGEVRGLQPGHVTVMAEAQGKKATASVTVVIPVTRLTMPVSDLSLLVGASVPMVATARDSLDRPLYGRSMVWASSDAAIAEIQTDGTIVGRAPGTVTISAASEGVAAEARVTVTRARFTTVQPSFGAHTCALSDAGQAFCWGANDLGQLGIGLPGLARGPVAVAGGRRFGTIVGGGPFTCALAAGGGAWCWGSGSRGRLGNGSIENQPMPAPVAGARSYGALASGWNHSCAVNDGGDAFCWGGGAALGSDVGKFSMEPLAVATGGFVQVSAGDAFSCGLDGAGAARCWGDNSQGQISEGSSLAAFTFSRIASGPRHTCALTTAGTAYCWGANVSGQLGDGSVASSATPVAVSGAPTFQSITAGAGHSCGLTAEGEAWCWGANSFGQLGDLSTIRTSLPVRSAPALRFTTMAAGGAHTCGIALDGIVWCWGSNTSGQLGDGSTVPRSGPVRVAGQQ